VGGNAPANVCCLVLAWVADHQNELLEAWQTCLVARQPAAIAPLP
jgi:hypothetical protein